MPLLSFTVDSPEPTGVGVALPAQGNVPVALNYVEDIRGPKVALVSGVATLETGSDLTVGFTTEVRIGDLDLTESLVSLDASIAVNKKMEARLGLVQYETISLAVIRPGWPVLIRHLRGGQEISRIEGYVAAKPSFSNGQYTVEVIGSPEVAAKNYCGPQPETAGQLARIYCQGNGLPASRLPEGHRLEEIVDNFIGSDLSILSDVYAPTEHDVYQDFQGRITVTKPGRSTRLRRDQYISIRHGTPAPPLDFKVQIENTFSRYEGYGTRTEEYVTYSDNYDENNTYPFFSGGWLRTETTDTYVGSTLVKRIEDVYGYTTNSDVFASDVKFLNCSLTSPVPTTLKLLYTKTTLLYTARLASSYDIVYLEEYNVNGLYAQDGQEDRGNGLESKWFLRNGQIERQVKKYVVTKQPVSDLCERDQAWLITDAYTQKFGFLNGGQYSLQNAERHWYTTDEPLDEDYKPVKKWVKHIVKGRYDQPTGNWVETPETLEYGQVPPEAGFVKPLLTQVTVRGYAEIYEGN